MVAWLASGLVQALEPYTGTLVVGGTGTLILGVVIFFRARYGHRGVLTAETALLGGMLIQYLIAPTLLRIASGDYANLWMTQERAVVKGAYPGAMLLTVAFGMGVVVGTELGARLFRQPTAEIETSFSGTGRIFVVLAAILWSARLMLLATGSYYHLLRSDFQLEDWRYSILSQINRTLGLVLVCYLTLVWLARRWRTEAVWLYIGADLVWNFASGSREATLLVLLSVAVAYVIRMRAIPARTLAIGAIGAVALVSFMDRYRYAIRSTANVDELSYEAVAEAVARASVRTSEEGLGRELLLGTSRFGDLDSVAAFYKWVPHAVPHASGESYLDAVYALIPRPLWPNKPESVRTINRYFFTRELGSSPTTTIGEGYLNFGWPGVLAAGLVCGVLTRATERLAYGRSRRVNALRLAIYCSFVLTAARLHTQPLAVWVGMVWKTAAFALLTDAAIAIAAFGRRRMPSLPEAGRRRNRPGVKPPLPRESEHLDAATERPQAVG
jgi:hypothetical protein